ncbi:MAG: cupin domain-containing protein [Acidimicrobiales bacterium]|jgi:quercetin dioxygenase-like cupin family protein|nr:cupin domain-containing protein [Acidimicrobiales bacterium]
MTTVVDTSTEPVPADGTLSRTLHRDDHVKVVLFAFDAGQELSEHRAGTAATVTVTRGRLAFTVDGETHEMGPGAFLHMAAGAPHALRALEPTIMVLTLVRDDVATTDT